METRRSLNDAPEIQTKQKSPIKGLNTLRNLTIGSLALALTACAENPQSSDPFHDAAGFFTVQAYPSETDLLTDADADGFQDWYEEEQGTDPYNISDTPDLQLEKIVSCDQIIGTSTHLNPSIQSKSSDCVNTDTNLSMDLEKGVVHFVKIKTDTFEGNMPFGAESHTGFNLRSLWHLDCGRGDQNWEPVTQDCSHNSSEDGNYYMLEHFGAVDYDMIQNELEPVYALGYEHDQDPSDDEAGYETNQNIDEWTLIGSRNETSGEYATIGIYFNPEF